MRSVFRASLMVGIAVAVGVGAAAAFSDTVLRATLVAWFDGGQDYSELNKLGLFFTNNEAAQSNQIRMYDGPDVINMGAGFDTMAMGLGPDLIAMGGTDNQTEAITFDQAGYGSNGATNSAIFIRADTPETAPKITICADDVVIQLGK